MLVEVPTPFGGVPCGTISISQFEEFPFSVQEMSTPFNEGLLVIIALGVLQIVAKLKVSENELSLQEFIDFTRQ